MPENNMMLQQDYLDDILEHSQDGIYITDNEANTVYLNHSYERISGLRRSEMIGKNMKDLVANGVISSSGTLSVLETGETLTIEQSFRTGKRATITSSPVFENGVEGGHIIMVVTIVREITEIYSIRKELQRLHAQNNHYMNEIQKMNDAMAGEVCYVTADVASQKLFRLAERVSLLDSPILISGEAGTGKETLARYIHSHSVRKAFPFLRIDWSAGTKDDPVKYLFGHENALTGEYDIGILESANGGTVYVDQIEHMPDAVVGRFLSLLRTGACMMGDGVERKLNIRLIMSSHYSYGELLHKKRVDEEILKCFAMFPLEILPLRNRQADIIPLIDFFLEDYNLQTGDEKRFSKVCYKRLLAYPWPDNVREVKNLVHRACIISSEDVILEEDLLLDEAAVSKAHADISINTEPGEGNQDVFYIHRECNDLKYESARLEAFYMKQAFEKYGNIRNAAASLGIDSSTFVRKRQRYASLGLME